jgi:DNA replication factor GINS
LDEFFQNLREIQKKERSLSSLSPVGDDFYQQISNYFNRLMKRIDSNPFSFESYLLRDAQRIVVEICERREYKITNSAVMNAQRSYHLFKDSKGDTRPKIPLNSTPEEENLYREIYQSLTIYREEMRSPLISYSKDIKKDSFYSLKATKTHENDIKVPKADLGIDEQSKASKKTLNHDEFNKDHVIPEKPRKSAETSPAVDEIPPEIQDEIYRQFGREPTKEGSQKSDKVSSGKKISVDSRNSSNVPDNIKNEFEENQVHSGDNDVSELLKDNSGLHKMSTEILMILDELPSIMGVDSKVYGPFYPGDIITMPEPNARILIKNQKGKSIQRYK